jgi:hypothetical protein
VLTDAIARQRFQSIAGRDPKVVQSRRLVEHRELAHGDALYVREPRDPAPAEHRFSLLAAEGLDHGRY